MVLLFIGAMSGLVLSGSLLTMYFFWEVCGICSFSLIGFHYDDPKALKGAIKAFITTRIGDVGLMSGVLVLYFSSAPHLAFHLVSHAIFKAQPHHAVGHTRRLPQAGGFR